MKIWLNNELDNLEGQFGIVAKNDKNRISTHYDNFEWWQRGKEERKLKRKVEEGNVDEVYLYRYISISKFWQIISSQKINLLNPGLWKDPLESPFFNAKIKINGKYQETPFKNRFFAQCFTLNDSSESMWKTYGTGEKLIRLKIKVGAIKKLIEENHSEFDSSKFYLGRVVYLNFEDIKYLFQERYLFQKAYKLTHIEDQVKTLLVKRYAYSFEKEVRLIFDGHEHFNGVEKKPEAIELNISNLGQLISEILLDPDLSNHETNFYKKAWNFVPEKKKKKCNLYSKKEYQLKLS